MNGSAVEPKAIYWHRDLPPIDAQPMGEHVLEAVSPRVPDTLTRRDELWNRCEVELMSAAGERLREEIARLGGRCAHVLHETIEPRHDRCSGEAWLYGRFAYELYR